MLESLVVDDLIGGIEDLYNDNQRETRLGELKSKYGEKFSPFEDVISEFYPGQDIYGSLLNSIEELKGNEDFDEDAHVNSIIEAIKAKVEKLRGAPSVKVTEVEGGEGDENGQDDQSELIERLKRMKKMHDDVSKRD